MPGTQVLINARSPPELPGDLVVKDLALSLLSAQVQFLAWELPCAMGVAKRKWKKKKKVRSLPRRLHGWEEGGFSPPSTTWHDSVPSSDSYQW